jgi:hypothetical protein
MSSSASKIILGPALYYCLAAALHSHSLAPSTLIYLFRCKFNILFTLYQLVYEYRPLLS